MEITTNNRNSDSNNTLSIQVSLNGLSFCVVNQDQLVTVLEQENFGIQLTPSQVLDKIKLAFDNFEALDKDFKSVEVLYQNDLYTLVPKALFDPNSLKDYLKYNIRILDTDFIAYDELSQHDLVNVYIPYININNFFFETFGSFTYRHTISVLTNTLQSKEKNAEHTVVYAHMNTKYVDILIFRKGKLLLSNSYFYDNEEDFLYYLLFAAEQLHLNPEEFQLLFLGDISKESSYYAIAYKYIRNISFGERSDTVEFAQSAITPNPQKHFLLLSTI